MGAVYLAALILGLGVLLLQFAMPGADGGDTDGAALGGQDDLELHHGASGGHAGHGGHHVDAGAIAIFLSLRFWTFGLMSFGFVGTLLHFLHLASPVTALVTATLVGSVSGFLASFAMRAIARSETSSGGEADEAVGRIGRVLVAVERGKHGKVRIELQGRLLDLIATTDGERLDEGESIIVEEMRGTTACVSHAGDSLAPSALK